MTKIDGFTVSPELVQSLKMWCPRREYDETLLMSYIDYISRIQDFLCRHMDELPPKCMPEISEYLGELVTIKDDLKRLEKLLPIITNEEREAS